MRRAEEEANEPFSHSGENNKGNEANDKEGEEKAERTTSCYFTEMWG